MEICEIFRKIGQEKITEMGTELLKVSMIDTSLDELNTVFHKLLEDIPDISSEQVIDALKKENAISFNPLLQMDITKLLTLAECFET